jgi:hypothetical protein
LRGFAKIVVQLYAVGYLAILVFQKGVQLLFASASDITEASNHHYLEQLLSCRSNEGLSVLP